MVIGKANCRGPGINLLSPLEQYRFLGEIKKETTRDEWFKITPIL